MERQENDLQLLNEQLLLDITALRSQNDQLWRIIEKQRATIIQLQFQLQQQQPQPQEQQQPQKEFANEEDPLKSARVLAPFLPPSSETRSNSSSVATIIEEEDEREVEQLAISNTCSEITRKTSAELSSAQPGPLPVNLAHLEATHTVGLTRPIPVISPLLPSITESLQKIASDASFHDESTATPTDGDESPNADIHQDVVSLASSASGKEEHALAMDTDLLFDDASFQSNRDAPLPDRSEGRGIAEREGIDSVSSAPSASSSPVVQSSLLVQTDILPFSSSPISRSARKTFSVFIPPPAVPPPPVVSSVRPSAEDVAVESSSTTTPPRPSVNSIIKLNRSSETEDSERQETSQHVQDPQQRQAHLSFNPPSFSQHANDVPQRPNSESVIVSGISESPLPPPHLYHKLNGMKLPTPPQLPPRKQNVSSQPSSVQNTNLETESDRDDVAPRARSESEPGKPPTCHFHASTRSQSQPADSKQSSVSALDLLDELSVRVVGSTIKINEKGREVLAFTFAVFKKNDSSSSRTPSELWKFEKFYSDFLAFDAKIKPALFEINGGGGKNATSTRKKLPDKSLFNNCAPSKVDQRKAGLEEYLCWILSVPALRQDYTVKEFLSSDLIPPASSGTHSTARGDRTEGYLTKRGKSFGKWKTRYFVIRDGLLHYYDSKDGNHLGTVGLKNSKIGKQQARVEDDKEKETGYRHAFIILEPKRAGISINNNAAAVRHVLCADSDEVRDEWVTSFAKVIDGKPLIKQRHEQRRSNGGVDKVSRSSGTKASLETVPVQHESPNENRAPTNEKPSRPTAPSHASRFSVMAPPFSMSSVDNMLQPNGPQAVIRGQEKSRSLPSPPTSRQKPVATSSSSSTSLFDDAQSPPPHHAPKLHKGGVNAAITGPIFVDRSSNPTSSRTNRRISVFNPPPGMMHGDRKNQHQFTQRQSHRDGLANTSDAEDAKIADKKTGRLTFLWGNKKENKLDLPAPLKPASSQNPPQDSRPLILLNGGMVFGVPLEKAIARARVKESYELPAVVYRAIEYLEAKDAYQEEGLYRLSGSTADIRQLRERYNNNGDFNLLADKNVYHDVHAVAGLLKLYLRELPASVLTTELQSQFLHVMDLLDRRDRIMELARLVSLLPLANYTLLRALISHLIKVVSNSSVNKMTIRNIGIVFSPTLGIPAGIFALLMTEFEYIFWVGDNEGTAQEMLKEPNGTLDSTEGSRKTDTAVAKPVVAPSARPVPSVGPSSNTTLTTDTIREYVAAMDAGLEEKERQRKAKTKMENETKIETWANETESENDIGAFAKDGRNKRNSSCFMKSAPAEVVERERRIQNVVCSDESGAEDLDDLTIQVTDLLPDADLLQPSQPTLNARPYSTLLNSGDMYSLLTMYGDFNGTSVDQPAPVDLQLAAFDTTAHLSSPVFPLTVRNGNRDSSGSDASRNLLMYPLDRNNDSEAQSPNLFGEPTEDAVLVV